MMRAREGVLFGRAKWGKWDSTWRTLLSPPLEGSLWLAVAQDPGKPCLSGLLAAPECARPSSSRLEEVITEADGSDQMRHQSTGRRVNGCTAGHLQTAAGLRRQQ